MFRVAKMFKLDYDSISVGNIFQLVPSLDTQTNYLEPVTAKEIIELFLDDFPLSKIAHFGPNLSSILIENRKS